MLSVLVTLILGAVFGLALAAPPGPMNAIIAEESVLRGWNAGFWAGVGAMLADVIFFVLALAGVVTLVDGRPGLVTALYLVGGVLMLGFAVDAIRDASATSEFTGAETATTGFRKALALSLTNPYQIGFWLTVGVGLLQPGTVDVFAHVPGVGEALEGDLVVQTGSPALLTGFFGGILVWVVVYPAALVVAGRRVNTFAPVVAALSGVVLAAFGVVFLTMGVLRAI